MTATWRRAAVGAGAIAVAVIVVQACGKSRTVGPGDTGGPQPSGNEKTVAAAGFKLEILSADLPADATSDATPPTVTFRATDENGTPIQNLKDELASAPAGSTPAKAYPYTNAPRFTLARLEPDDTYHSLYVSAQNGQAVSVTLPRDPAQFDARVTPNGNGSYTFKLDKLPANPSGDERGRTWRVGVWASHRPSRNAGEDEAASSTFDFVPSGGTPTGKQIVSLAACNTCHAPAVRAHGTRLGVELCQTCHTPQTVDPDTGNSVEFVELIHKIHYGGDRPGPAYRIIGFQNQEAVFDDEWINDVRNCTLCHQGANASRHLENPNQRACTTCHSVVKLDGSAAAPCALDRKDTADCNHPVQIAQGTACSACHTPSALQQQHIPIGEYAGKFVYDIQGVTVGGDRKPTVRFAVRNKDNDQPRDLENDPAYRTPASSLNVQLGWPSQDYGNAGGSATAPGQPRSISVVRGGAFQAATVTKVAGQPGVYEVTSPVALPDGVTSATVFMDGHPVARGENLPVVNAVKTFGTDGGTGEARRKIVDIASCNKCHGPVSAHGRNRNGNLEACVVCHNPYATDRQKRQGTEGAGSESSIDFKVLIHEVHSADIRKDPVTIYGFNAANAATGGAPGKPEQFPGGEIPHGVANCNKCHVNGTYRPPLSADAQDTTIATNDLANPADDTKLGKTQAVCTSCHDQVHFTQDASNLPRCDTLEPVNSAACVHSGGVPVDEASCAGCHGRGGAADVQRVHDVQ
jgi:OmcA/MtrC family decaheme c-type cytochrome